MVNEKKEYLVTKSEVQCVNTFNLKVGKAAVKLTQDIGNETTKIMSNRPCSLLQLPVFLQPI